MSERSETPAFVAYVYEKDYEAIQKLVHQYPHIETGGDLFGLWKDKKTVVIQQFIGPGKECKRTSASFHQDIEYLHRVGSLITTEEGLCNVGEWHSHHQIGMPEPSGADRRTVFSNMPHLGLERFVLFIASIEGKGSSGDKRSHDVKLKDIILRPFLFLGSTQKVVKGDIKIIPGSNPHRLNSRAENEIENGKELPEQGKNKKEAPISTKKTKNVPTVIQQAKPKMEAHGQSGAEPATQKGNQTQRRGGFNNENRSPNTSSAAPTDRGPRSLPTYSTSQMNTQALNPQTTSAPNSLSQDRDASSLFGTAQGHGRGNTQPTGGAYSSAQSPQHPSYTQQTNQSSARDRSHGAQDTNQAQAIDRSGTIPVGKLNKRGFF